jgi:hypothetical protein
LLRSARNDEQESRTPTNAVQQPPRLAARHAPVRARSPVGVPPRRLRSRPNATAQLQLTRFPGHGRSARPRWFERRHAFFAGITRAFLPQSSEFQLADRSSCRPDVSCRSRPGAEVTSPPRGNRPAPPAGVEPDGVLVRERDSQYVTKTGTVVKIASSLP